MREGLYYNPYFPGGAIAMPKMLADGGTEYDDDTVTANEAQQAKVWHLTLMPVECVPGACRPKILSGRGVQTSSKG